MPSNKEELHTRQFYAKVVSYDLGGKIFIFFFKLHMKLFFIFEKYSKIVYKNREGFQEYLG